MDPLINCLEPDVKWAIKNCHHVKNTYRIPCTVELGNKELFGHPKIAMRTLELVQHFEIFWVKMLVLILGYALFLNTNVFLIKPFLIVKFDCTNLVAQIHLLEAIVHFQFNVSLCFHEMFMKSN